jgi:hypothetical protein
MSLSHCWLIPLSVALSLGACGKDAQAPGDTETPDTNETSVGDAAEDAAPEDTTEPQDLAEGDTARDGDDPPDGDAETDATPDCGDAVCGPFEYCEADTCVAYPACSEMETCEGDDDVCRNAFCVPGDLDIDGDGSPARDDCDETNIDINPSADEICNGIDDNCNSETDEGDAVALCATSGTGDFCVDGGCVCADNAFSLDPEVLGCECESTPTADQGVSCQSPIDLGDFSDDGSSIVVRGTILPEDRSVWYRFRGVDSPDTSCDNYHVRVRFESDPDAAYAIDVCRQSCADANCTNYLVDYDWRTDFRGSDDGRLTGQCPCTAPGAPRLDNVSVCSDDTTHYFVRVYRRPNKPVLCSPYAIEISNGLYSTP